MIASCWNEELKAYQYFQIREMPKVFIQKNPNNLGWTVEESLTKLPCQRKFVGIGAVPRGTLMEYAPDLSWVYVTLFLGGLIYIGNTFGLYGRTYNRTRDDEKQMRESGI